MSAYATTLSWSEGLLGSHLNVELDQAEGGFRLVYGGKGVSVVWLWSPTQRFRSFRGAVACGARGASAAKSARLAVPLSVWTMHGHPAKSGALESWCERTWMASWRGPCIQLKSN